ncbi:MAG: hypothetical protein KKF39_05225 [Nanoarchaeota archaeon]|nr:hypothetical protein [Nanoarchaeota archaeon]
MTNQSKIKDPRFWRKWLRSGAVGTLANVTVDYDAGLEPIRERRMVMAEQFYVANVMDSHGNEPIAPSTWGEEIQGSPVPYALIDPRAGVYIFDPNPRDLGRFVAGLKRDNTRGINVPGALSFEPPYNSVDAGRDLSHLGLVGERLQVMRLSSQERVEFNCALEE